MGDNYDNFSDQLTQKVLIDHVYKWYLKIDPKLKEQRDIERRPLFGNSFLSGNPDETLQSSLTERDVNEFVQHSEAETQENSLLPLELKDKEWRETGAFRTDKYGEIKFLS